MSDQNKQLAKSGKNQLSEQEREIQVMEINTDFDLPAMVTSTGDVKLTDKQRKILFAPVPDEQVEIRPDGIVYLPHIFYSGRLREAFGWEFAVIPKGDPKFIADKNLIVWGFYMIVKGSLMAYAIGHQMYYSSSNMTYIDACEGAKSNAVMRLCKDLGISTQLWEPEWRKDWTARWAYKTKERNAKGQMKDVWKKKAVANGNGKEKAEKSEEYLEVENGIRKILDDPRYTGPAQLVDIETGEITDYDLDKDKSELLSRLNSPQVFGDAIMKKIEARCAKLLLAVVEAEVKIDKGKVEIVGEDTLGDEDAPGPGDNLFKSLDEEEHNGNATVPKKDKPSGGKKK